MKIVTLILLGFYSILNLQAQNVIIPDINFKSKLLAYSPSIDINNDQEIQVSEAQLVKILRVPFLSIKDLTGIEAFTSLTELYCYDNELTSLNISNNKSLTILWCQKNQLASLDVSSNTKLTNLITNTNNLKVLDLNSNIALSELECSGNQITTLDLSKNLALTQLSCSSNKLSSLDVRINTSLVYLYCDGNSSLQTICLNSTQESKTKSKPAFWSKDITATWSSACATGIEDIFSIETEKVLHRITDFLGHEILPENAINGVFIFQYKDGTVRKIAK